MRFSFYINDTKEVQAVSFTYKGIDHCSADFRTFSHSVHFSNTTKDNKMQELMDKTFEMDINSKVVLDLPDEVLDFDFQEHGISGIYFEEKSLHFLS